MKLDLTEILNTTGSVLEFKDNFSVSFPKEEVELDGPISVDISFINAGEFVIAHGEIKTNILFECGRCLKKFSSAFDVSVDDKYVKKIDRHVHFKEVELDEDDFAYPIEEDNTIDLDEAIRQNLIASLPISSVCDESCKGFVTEELSKKRIDPRLLKLKEAL